MTYHVLPKLRPDHNVKTLTESGVWIIGTTHELKNISSGLKVDDIETEINSIPDMWARPMLFEMALLDPDHVLHQRILGEWRGLLAMLALKEVLKLNRLTVSQVTLPPLVIQRDEETPDSAPRDFLITLSKLLPSTSLSPDTSWQNLYVFLFAGRPIGLASPTTLVATSADYLNAISNQEVAWYNGSRLLDPIPKLSSTQKRILSGWLRTLQQKVNSHPGILNDKWNLISGLLDQFTAKLGTGSCTLSQSGFGITGTSSGIFKYFDKPADDNVTTESHVRLLPSLDRHPAKPLLVYDRNIADQWDLPLHEVILQNAQTLASSNIEAINADIWRETDFFTPFLFVVFQQNAFPNTYSPNTQSLTLPGGASIVTPILPLRFEILNHLTAEDLSQRVRWEQTAEGLKLHLFLKLSGPEGNGKTVELTKLYRRDLIQTLDNVPILEVWPNFEAANWKAYYICYSADDVTNTFSASPFTSGQPISSEVNMKGRGQRRYWRTETYPEAIVCHASVPNPQTNQMETTDAGLLLLVRPQTVQPRDLTYRVGIDFGAANTTICIRRGDQPAVPVRLLDRKVPITAVGETAQAGTFDLFLPPSDIEMPLLSFYQTFDNAESGQELQPFLNGHVYLLPNAPALDPNQGGMTFDLKWSMEESDRKKIKAFLLQLCLQTAAELVWNGAAKVGWAFSYPTAFTDDQKEGFPGIWKQVTTECASLTGLTLTSRPYKQTESVATALYFVDHLGAAPAMGTIFIDIGGSTSDIAIWQGDNKTPPVWQTSVLLAGRALFSSYLWHNPEFLGLFGVGKKELPEEKTKAGKNSIVFYALTDAFLRYNSEKIFTELPLHAGSQQVKALRQHLALGVCGLFYYVGSLLQYLMQIGVYRSNIPNVYVGGNGSKIFRWLDIDGDEHINALYKAVFSRGAGWTNDQPFRVILSPEPKMEAAYGLIADSKLPEGNNVRKVLAGESFIAEGRIDEWAEIIGPGTDAPHKLDWNNVLTAEAFTKQLKPAPSFERLTDFISAFNSFAKNKGLVAATDISNLQAEEVRRKVGQSISQYHDALTTANIIVEPIFIIALRNWLDLRIGDRVESASQE